MTPNVKATLATAVIMGGIGLFIVFPVEALVVIAGGIFCLIAAIIWAEFYDHFNWEKQAAELEKHQRPVRRAR